MAMLTISQHANSVRRFVIIQLVALIGWILVQTFFTLSPPGRTIPFSVIIVIEAIWWTVTLVMMFMLFRRIYGSFVQAAVDLEEANKRLRQRTNTILSDLSNNESASQGN
ncbi:MAG TPA: hypothetical protein VNE61_10180 [Ktedonobacteraceae bacterium]|nr:hypothetical protein [Ktedonobacteraceae bacterium]